MAYRDKLVNIRAPELSGGPEDWLNTDGNVLQLEKDRIYLIDFWDYTCVNCIRTLPYLKEWHKRYAGHGLTIIGIHTPEFKFAASRENVEHAVKRLGLEYPILLDSDYLNWRAFANRYWPRKYLVDKDGYIVYDHAGEGAYGDTEQAIQEQIRLVFPDAGLPVITEPVTGTGEIGAVCYPVTPELYAGYYRGIIGNMEGYQEDQVVDYSDLGMHHDGAIYLEGPWYSGAEFIRHARRTNEPDDYIAVAYQALEVNAVVRSSDGSTFDVLVTQDGKPVDKQDKGEDIFYADGKSYIRVDEPRMYRIIKNREFGSHEVTLSSASDAFELYAFTFVSCEEPA